MDDTSNFNREIRTTAVDFSFGEILNLHNDKEIVIRPEYQRLFRWSTEQRSRLIESIILGLPIPPIFLIEGNNGILELIDGLQRTSSVLQFLDHSAIGEPELILVGCDILPELNGRRFQDLPLAVRLKVKRSPIRATIINKSGDAFVKYEMFKRLNTGGSLLSAQEIRNCSSRMVDGGDLFYDAIQEMAKYPAFIETTSRLPDSFKEKRADEELVLRFFAATTYRERYKGNIEEWLDSFMEDVLFQRAGFNLSEQRSHFEKVFKLINDKAGDEAFTRFNEDGEPTGRLAPAYYEAAVCAFSNNYPAIEQMTPQHVKDQLRLAFSDPDFLEATGPGANTIQKLENRISVVSKYLSE
ncbi:hypothetical protein Pcar_0794 [Syntrophotalea carbinolica DSM 2380]|uniref:GmrSD restriction endonucleases N-terminal domain-containing protein n=1 Tax=Syntrophotalea carbinolica (strain DSM 2380 / NBRC 103641 / GraBd1) TaxID=338963 RepID=Q3A6F6_SYNC1|nr:DUF262 domain-containing protein [Syntrophotalea carbinolica]ABA88051.1 hypothetical protein Pcar_0794 [Syntrophotalea carbinolica DSM 2380]